MWAIAAPNSPTTTSAACRAAVPGHDPVPLAVAKTLTGQPYSIEFRAPRARARRHDYAHMMTRRLMLCGAALLAAACTRITDGTALPAFGAGPNLSGVDVDRVLLDQDRMRAITGADEHLTIIPSMDGKSPVDVDTLAKTAPTQCRFVYEDTATFGPDIEEFHKTTFQYPPRGGLISEGAAAYHDANTAHHAFDALVATVRGCANTPDGAGFVGSWIADDRSLQTRPGDCGRDYEVKSVVLMEVTFCGFPESVSTIVITNIAANVPD
jgi:PknH-like extracellular domain